MKWAIGAGLALFPVHNAWLVNVSTTWGGTWLFLPGIGLVLLLLGATLTMLHSRIQLRGLGNKAIWIPLAVIALAISLSGLAYEGRMMLTPLVYAVMLFCLYVSARVLGKDLFLPLAIGAAVASVGVVAYAGLHPGDVTGGFVFERNYDILIGYVLMGTVLFIHKWQWLLVTLALIALSLSGSPEFVFVIGILGVVVLLRRDWSRRLAVVVLVPVVLGSGLFATGYGQKLYDFTFYALRNAGTYNTGQMDVGNRGEPPVAGRWVVIKDEMSNIRPFGRGYNVMQFGQYLMVHNVPLVLVQQLGWPGVAAAIAWLWVSIWCLVKTKWKYAWTAILALSVFDHYIWTQFAPLWWTLVGVSTASPEIQTDLAFKRVVA